MHNNHNLTLIIVDNGTTAMTGQQPHPGIDAERINLPRTRVPIEQVVKGLGVTDLEVISPRLNPRSSSRTVERAANSKGVSVIISREICPLYAKATG